MKKIDFDKPIRFVEDKEPAHFIGPSITGNFVIEEARRPGDPFGPLQSAIYLDEYGRSRNGTQVIENAPKRITRWMWIYTDSGYATKEDALEDSPECPDRNTLIKIEFVPGERQ